LINTLIKRFDKTVFQQKLINWIVNSNQSFSIVNDQDLRDIFNYLNPSVELRKANITDVTVRAMAEREFTNNKFDGLVNLNLFVPFLPLYQLR